MKKNILKSFSALAVIIMAASCETLDYNEKNFGDLGYESDPEITDVQVLEITLTADDYSTIAGLYDNTYMAESAGLSDELSAVGTNGYFSDAISGSDYIPAYLESVYDSYLSVGSKIKVTYDTVAGESAELAAIMAGEAYTVSSDDYASVWGEVSAAYFTPSVTAASNLPTILAAALPEAVEGDYALVTYAYSASEPSTGGGDDESGDDSEADTTVYDAISDAANTDNAGSDYFVKGTVVAVTSRSYLVQDTTGSILVYIGSDPGVSIGDVVTIAGTTSSYAGFCQFSSSATVETVGTTSVAYTTPVEMSASDLDDYLTDPTIIFAKYTGTLSISGSYTNITVAGTSTASPSISYAVDGLYDTALDGQEVDVYGYLTGVSTSKYVATMAVAIVASGTDSGISSIYDAISIAADTDNAGNSYTVCGAVVAVTSRSYLVSDSTGSILVYIGSDPGVSVGDVVTVSGTTSSYAGFCQFSSSATVATVGTTTVTYPTPIEMSAADLDAYLTDPVIEYVKYTGTLSISGSYTNITVAGTSTASPSISYAVDGLYDTALDGQEVDVYGYLTGVSSSKYVATMATAIVASSSSSASAPAKASVVTSSLNVVYYFNGTAWSAADDTVMLTSDDYTAMGSTYGNLSGTQNETLVPIYLANNYPYAVEGDEIVVVYKYYSGSTFYKASTYIKGAADWTMVGDIETVVGAPFEKKSSGWIYDPSMTISIGTTDSDNIALYFPTMLSYVKSKYGSEYIDSYGTSEYYSGSASYYGNINWRYSYVLGYWEDAGIDISQYYTHTNGSDGLVAMYDVLKANLAETFAYALSVHNSDANAVDGMEVLYTVQFGLYYGPSISGANAEMIFEVVGPAEFEFVELNFLDDTADVYSDDNLSYVISTYGTYYQ